MLFNSISNQLQSQVKTYSNTNHPQSYKINQLNNQQLFNSRNNQQSLNSKNNQYLNGNSYKYKDTFNNKNQYGLSQSRNNTNNFDQYHFQPTIRPSLNYFNNNQEYKNNQSNRILLSGHGNIIQNTQSRLFQQQYVQNLQKSPKNKYNLQSNYRYLNSNKGNNDNNNNDSNNKGNNSNEFQFKIQQQSPRSIKSPLQYQNLARSSVKSYTSQQQYNRNSLWNQTNNHRHLFNYQHQHQRQSQQRSNYSSNLNQINQRNQMSQINNTGNGNRNRSRQQKYYQQHQQQVPSKQQKQQYNYLPSSKSTHNLSNHKYHHSNLNINHQHQNNVNSNSNNNNNVFAKTNSRIKYVDRQNSFKQDNVLSSMNNKISSTTTTIIRNGLIHNNASVYNKNHKSNLIASSHIPSSSTYTSHPSHPSHPSSHTSSNIFNNNKSKAKRYFVFHQSSPSKQQPAPTTNNQNKQYKINSYNSNSSLEKQNQVNQANQNQYSYNVTARNNSSSKINYNNKSQAKFIYQNNCNIYTNPLSPITPQRDLSASKKSYSNHDNSGRGNKNDSIATSLILKSSFNNNNNKQYRNNNIFSSTTELLNNNLPSSSYNLNPLDQQYPSSIKYPSSIIKNQSISFEKKSSAAQLSLNIPSISFNGQSYKDNSRLLLQSHKRLENSSSNRQQQQDSSQQRNIRNSKKDITFTNNTFMNINSNPTINSMNSRRRSDILIDQSNNNNSSSNRNNDRRQPQSKQFILMGQEQYAKPSSFYKSPHSNNRNKQFKSTDLLLINNRGNGLNQHQNLYLQGKIIDNYDKIIHGDRGADGQGDDRNQNKNNFNNFNLFKTSMSKNDFQYLSSSRHSQHQKETSTNKANNNDYSKTMFYQFQNDNNENFNPIKSISPQYLAHQIQNSNPLHSSYQHNLHSQYSSPHHNQQHEQIQGLAKIPTHKQKQDIFFDMNNHSPTNSQNYSFQFGNHLSSKDYNYLKEFKDKPPKTVENARIPQDIQNLKSPIKLLYETYPKPSLIKKYMSLAKDKESQLIAGTLILLALIILVLQLVS